MTGTGRVCGESASSAPGRMTISAPRLVKPLTRSLQNPRQRMFGSMPRTRMMSAARCGPSLGGLAPRERLVVGQTSRRVLPSLTSSTGRLTWKS